MKKTNDNIQNVWKKTTTILSPGFHLRNFFSNIWTHFFKTGKWIYRAGINWKQFDYEKGLNILIQKDKTGEWIYYAGKDWLKFDYEKGLDTLKRFPKYYRKVLKKWQEKIKERKVI